MVFYNDTKKIMPSSPPRRRTFRGTFRKNFLGHFKKNIVQRNVAEKKILASNWGMKKNSFTEKLPNPPPQISNGPSLSNTFDIRMSDLLTIQFRLSFKDKGHKSLEYYCLVIHLTSVISTISYPESNGDIFIVIAP